MANGEHLDGKVPDQVLARFKTGNVTGVDVAQALEAQHPLVQGEPDATHIAASRLA